MKKLFLVAIAATAMLLASCTTISPMAVSSIQPLEGKSYKVLGRVTVKDDAESGYSKLLETAREMFPRCDEVVNVVTDYKFSLKSMIFNLGRPYCVMSGVAIDYDEL